MFESICRENTNLLTKFIETLHESLDMKLSGGGGNIPHSTQRYVQDCCRELENLNQKSSHQGKRAKLCSIPIHLRDPVWSIVRLCWKDNLGRERVGGDSKTYKIRWRVNDHMVKGDSYDRCF